VSTETATLLAGAALLVGLLALLLGFWLVLRTRRLARLGEFRPQMPESLQAALEREVERLDALARQVDDVSQRLPPVEQRSMAAVQRVGIVRFNPYGDTGGQQSFSVAMLDGEQTGFVISSLHSRQQTRVYLKQISQGQSDTPLSDEESQALRQAGVGG
jgi:Protein of unknown function (DUF4446)